ncbi:phage/plasmid primase, P4 family [Nibrella saemangeumensis]|uniref:Phage/plasmid primase, P4 family n=1 Tax=Nibrella saemangeumensis TaxID=1084526 RepID=A0ABP8MD89_9BACT
MTVKNKVVHTNNEVNQPQQQPTTNLSDAETSNATEIPPSIEVKTEETTGLVLRDPAELLDSMLEQVGLKDFKQALTKDKEQLKDKHQQIIVVETIMEIADHNKWGLCKQNAFLYIYNGAYWQVVEEHVIRTFLKKAAEKMGVDKYDARYFVFGDQLVKQFSDQGYLPAPKGRTDCILINLLNGTFEITSEGQRLRSHDSGDFLTYQLPFSYDPSAKAPQWQQFLDKVLPDKECQKVLAEFIGYLFVSASLLKLEKALLLFGSGANGKSVFFEVIMALLGPENVSNYSLNSLTNDPAYHRAHLANKILNYASEINGRLEASIFKQLVSGEPVEARLPYGQPFIMHRYAKLIFNTNELPTDVEHTNAFFRRFLIVPFSVTIPEAEQDKELATKIIESELSGVFNWVLDGLNRLLQQKKFTDCKAILQQLESYKRESDSVHLFLNENEYTPDPCDLRPLKDLYHEYRGFCVDEGYKPVSSKNFKKRLENIGITIEKKSIGLSVYIRKF